MTHIDHHLLAYLDGELSPADTQFVEAHLTQCTTCAVALRELRELRAGLRQVVPAVAQSMQLPPAAETRIRQALAAERNRLARGRGLQGWLDDLLAGLVALGRPLSKAAVPLVAVVFVVLTGNAARLPQQAGVQQTLLLGQDTFAPGTEAAVRVLVRDQESNQPIANAEVDVHLRQAGLSRTVYSGRTDDTGTAPVRFEVPADWQGAAELEVEASSELGSERLTEPIRLQRTYRLLLSSDKPVYQPGETIHLRTLALGAVAGRPAAGALTRFEVLDPQGHPLLDEERPASDFGIAAIDLPLAANADQGRYQLRATLADTTSELTVQVSQAELPSFRVDVEADHPFYLAGETLTGQVSASYFFGKPVANARAQLRLLAFRPGTEADAGTTPLFVADTEGQAGADGLLPFQFALPQAEAIEFGPDGTLALALEATVVDPNGDAEFGWQTLTLANQPVQIDVVAEDGTLHSGVENILYILTSTPDGLPVTTSLQVQIGSGSPIRTAATEFGLAEVRFVPRAGETGTREVTVTATDDSGRQGTSSQTLPLDTARETLLLRTDRALYQVGDTLALEALATGGGEAVYLDVIKGGQTMLTRSAPVLDAKATFALDLTHDLAGTLELNAYQVTANGQALQDTRVVVVDEPEGLRVTLSGDRPEYRPGETALVSIETSAGGQGQRAAVGVAAVNEAVYAQRAYRPGFARLYFFLDQALQQEGLPLVPGEAGAAQQQTAKAARASYQGRGFTLSAEAVDLESREAVNQARVSALRQVGVGLNLVLALFPLAVAAIVLRGLRRSRVLGQAAGRLLLTLLVLTVAGAAVLALLQALLNAFAGRYGLVILLVSGLLWLLALLGLSLYGWRRNDQRAQYVALLLLTYAVCLALMAFVSDQGVSLSTVWLLVAAASFGLLLAALFLFGWGLRLEGEHRAGTLVLLLALLVLPLVVSLNTVDVAGSDLIEDIAGPTVYGLHGGLLTGCAAPAAPQMAQEAPAELAPAAPPAEPAAAPMAAEQAVVETVVIEVERDVAVEEQIEVEVTREVESTLQRSLGATPAPAEPGGLLDTAAPEAALEAPIEEAEVAKAVAPAEAPLAEPAVETAPEPQAQALEAGTAVAGEATPTALPTPVPTPEPEVQPTATESPLASASPPVIETPSPTPEPVAPESAAPIELEAEAPLGFGRGGGLPEPTQLPPEALPIIRERFPQTLYWNPEVLTDERGSAQIEIPTGDSITTWRLTALAVGPNGELGSATIPLVVFQPLFLELDAPVELAVGDEVFLQVRVFNYGAQARDATLVTQATDGLAANLDLPTGLVRLPANEVVFLPLRVRALAPGPQTLTLSLQDESAQDSRQATIVVQP